jgi:26S proteasome regulatory subunit N3
MPDVDMTAAAPATTAGGENAGFSEVPLSPKALVLALLRHNLQLIVRSVAHLEPRFAARALRTATSTRKLCILHPDVLARLVEEGTAKGEYRMR